MANEGLTLVKDRWYTALTADVSAAATSLPVVTNVVGGNTLPTPCLIMCGFEQMYATASTATTITVTRGFASTAAAHAKGATVGIARTAAHHNDVVVAIAALGGAVTYGSDVATGSTDPTTTSGTPVALANPTVTMTTVGGTVLALARMTINCSTSAVINLYVRHVATGTFIMVGDVSPPSSAGRQTVSGFHLFTGLSAGSQTFDMGWATTGGTATSYGASRRILARELP
jgi:hypothetical protein